MLLPEDRSEQLIEQLRQMRPGDRRAVLRRLDAKERMAVRAGLVAATSPAAAPEAPESRYSPDFAARVDEAMGRRGEVRLTPAARDALARALNRAPGTAPAQAQPSLAQALGGLLRSRGRP